MKQLLRISFVLAALGLAAACTDSPTAGPARETPPPSFNNTAPAPPTPSSFSSDSAAVAATCGGPVIIGPNKEIICTTGT